MGTMSCISSHRVPRRVSRLPLSPLFTALLIATGAQASKAEAPTPSTSAPAPGLRAASSGSQLPALLAAWGKAEKEKEERSGCSYRESTLVEDLDGEGRAKGSLRRTWKVVRKGDSSTRTLLDSEQTGELNDLLTREPKDPTPEERKAQRSPFHPEQQAHFFFELLEMNDDRIRVSFRPKKRDPKWTQGTATFDAESQQLVSMTAKPSKMPPMVSALDLDLRFAPSACGVQPNRIRTQGHGGFLFMKLNFRSDTRIDQFEAPKG